MDKRERERLQSSPAQALLPQFPDTSLCCLKSHRQSFPGSPLSQGPHPAPLGARGARTNLPEEGDTSPSPPLPPHPPVLQSSDSCLGLPKSCKSLAENGAQSQGLLHLQPRKKRNHSPPPLPFSAPFPPSQLSCSHGRAPGLGCSTRPSHHYPAVIREGAGRWDGPNHIIPPALCSNVPRHAAINRQIAGVIPTSCLGQELSQQSSPSYPPLPPSASREEKEKP